jgi:predicted nucleotidyltransferase
MLKERILSTLKFFDLQDYPLTLVEISQFLFADLNSLTVDSGGELKLVNLETVYAKVPMGEILTCVEMECAVEIKNNLGFYFLTGRENIVKNRLDNYFYGIKREQLIKKYIKFLKYIPFVRGVALAGSQAMGQQKETSDIDLLVITDTKFMWLARTLVTIYFQVLGRRRHGQKIKNRFCLNHYLAGAKKIIQLKNFYTAHEYLKLRPLVYSYGIWDFQNQNKWVSNVFSNSTLIKPELYRPAFLQFSLEKIFMGSFGKNLEKVLKNWQLPKIRHEKFILVSDDELSFHPDSKQEGLLKEFLKNKNLKR